MPLLRINSGAKGLHIHQSSSPVLPALIDALARPGPVIIMVHGYKFAPGHSRGCPHRHILSLTPRSDCWKAKSWPKHLGFGHGDPREGLAIAFGWFARGTIWQAHLEAQNAARKLANLIAVIHALAPDRKVHILAHSMGARVALSALSFCPAKSVGRLILLNPAEYGAFGRTALESQAGKSAEILGVTTRANICFDFLFERLISRPERGDRSLAWSLPQQANTLTLHLDHNKTLAMFQAWGMTVSPNTSGICHWSTYLGPGLLEVYCHLLREPERYTLERMRQHLGQETLVHARPKPSWREMLRRRSDQAALLSSGGITMRIMNQ